MQSTVVVVDLDVELGASPVTPLSVVLQCKVSPIHRHGCWSDAPGSWYPSSSGTIGGWGYQHIPSVLLSSLRIHRLSSPVLAGRLGEDALCPESLLRRLHGTVSTPHAGRLAKRRTIVLDVGGGVRVGAKT